MDTARGKVALLWHGDREERRTATVESSRLNRVFSALVAHGIHAEPAVYADDMADEVHAQLLDVDGVLVWVNPISDSQNRNRLDGLLRDIASRGAWVSAHPDIILKMGVKEILHRTKHLGWGCDTQLYRSAEALRAEFPRRLETAGPRVLKRNRGNGGQGVWSVELLSVSRQPAVVRVLQAVRGSVPEDITLDDFMARCERYFDTDGCVVDQPFQMRLPEGMIRCYMGADKVVGFGHQLIKALVPPPPEGPDVPSAQPGPRFMHSNAAPQFQRLRTLMETEWTPQMSALLGIEKDSLPIIWDADFLYGPRIAKGEDTYVLCEINVSSVFPIPDQAPEEIARLVSIRLQAST